MDKQTNTSEKNKTIKQNNNNNNIKNTYILCQFNSYHHENKVFHGNMDKQTNTSKI